MNFAPKNLLNCIKYQCNESTKYKYFPNMLKMIFVITKLYQMFENDICDTKLNQMSKNDPNIDILNFFSVFGPTKCNSMVVVVVVLCWPKYACYFVAPHFKTLTLC